MGRGCPWSVGRGPPTLSFSSVDGCVSLASWLLMKQGRHFRPTCLTFISLKGSFVVFEIKKKKKKPASITLASISFHQCRLETVVLPPPADDGSVSRTIRLLSSRGTRVQGVLCLGGFYSRVGCPWLVPCHYYLVSYFFNIYSFPL